MRTAHKLRQVQTLRRLVRRNRNGWCDVEALAYRTNDPVVLVLAACIGAQIDLLHDHLDERLRDQVAA